MSHVVAIALGFLLAPFCYAGADAPELITDRPDQTESSETVAPGYVQFEFG